jgi:oxygen-independent coproporphyrinogen-3 oxidase
MYSLYISVPFCRARCAYCDFNSYAGLEALITPYSRAVAKEIEWVGSGCPEAGEPGGRPVAGTIFFGGGTPSLMPLEDLEQVLAAVRRSFELTSNSEITLEANPGTVDGAYLQGLRALEVNRLSLGVQSANPAELALLGRIHTFEEAVEAVRRARRAGFDNLNLDLILGLPGQTLAAWQSTLRKALDLQPDHLSCYILSLEECTPLNAQVEAGLQPMPDPDLAADMYEWTSETLQANGLEQYEISNWARGMARACRHNLTYWRNGPYLGFGAGAHGCAAGVRYSNVLTPQAFMERLEQHEPTVFPFSPAMVERIPVSADDAMGETLMLGMRLVQEGVSDTTFEPRFGVSLQARYGPVLEKLAGQGLVEWDGNRARLTIRGRLLGNVVFREFV